MFTEFIKEVLIPFSATQNANTNQITDKERQKKSEFLEENHIIFGKELVFPEPFTAFLLLHLLKSARTVNLTRHVCKKLLHQAVQS